MSSPRIYADFHGTRPSPRNPARLAVPLDTFGSLRDLSNAGIRLRDGVRLTVYADSDDDEDLEGDAIAYHSPELRLWLAELDDRGITHVPRRGPALADRFLCVNCRSPLPVATYGRPEGRACPICRTPITAAIDPPEEPAPEKGDATPCR